MRKAFIMAIALSAILVAAPVFADDSDASATVSAGGVNITIFDDSVSLSAGSSVSTSITFIDSDTSAVSVSLTCNNDANTVFSTSIDDSEFTLDPGGSQMVSVTMTTGKLSKHGTYNVNVTATVYNYTAKTTETATIPITVEVTSSYSSDGVYNRILGFLDPLDEPFDTPIVTATITLTIWVGLAVLAFIALRIIVFGIFKNDREAAREISNKTGLMLIISITFYGLSNALMTYGAD